MTKDYEKFHNETWKKLYKFRDAKDDESFWILYQAYLEKSGVLSKSRECLLHMIGRLNDSKNNSGC